MNHFFKSTLRSFLFFSLCFHSVTSFAQEYGITALPFLHSEGTPEENGMAGAFTALQSNSVYAAWYNPAQLGYTNSRSIAIGYSPKSTWNYSFGDLGIGMSNVGIRYQNSFLSKGKSIEYGISFHQLLFDFGEQSISDEMGNDLVEYNPYDLARTLSIGIGFEMMNGLRLNGGYSIRYIFSNLGNSNLPTVGDQPKYKSPTIFAHDLGFILDADIIKWTTYSNSSSTFKPMLQVRLGYAIKNIGDGVSYNLGTSDPLPRTAQVGISTTIGLKTVFKGKEFQIITVDLSRETKDLLIKIIPSNTTDTSSYTVNYKYQSPFSGDLSVVDNLLLGKVSNRINVNQGMRIGFLETLEISFGQLDGDGWENPNKTNGFVFDLRGLKKIYLDELYTWLIPFNVRISKSVVNHSYDFGNTVYWGIQVGYTF